jgi:hypothetical protein
MKKEMKMQRRYYKVEMAEPELQSRHLGKKDDKNNDSGLVANPAKPCPSPETVFKEKQGVYGALCRRCL